MGVWQWITVNYDFILIVIGLSLVPGIAAIAKGMRFWPFFLISFVISPLVSFIIVLCKKGEWQQFIEEKATNELVKRNNDSQKREGNKIVKILIWLVCILVLIGLRVALFFAVRRNLGLSYEYSLGEWPLTIIFTYIGCIIARLICYHMDIHWIKKYTDALG